jgi:hypothetical protein
MITGDYGLTAESVARRVGMLARRSPRLLTGAEVDALSDAGLQRHAQPQQDGGEAHGEAGETPAGPPDGADDDVPSRRPFHAQQAQTGQGLALEAVEGAALAARAPAARLAQAGRSCSRLRRPPWFVPGANPSSW